MSCAGSVTLSDLQSRGLARLEVSCSVCAKSGAYNLARLIEACGDLRLTDYLAELTADEDIEVQEAAIAALGQIGGPSSRSVLHDVAAETSDERVLEAVTDALAEADFVEDPLGFKIHLDDSVADDACEDDDE